MSGQTGMDLTRAEAGVPAAAETPQEAETLVAMAIREKVPVEVLERLVALQERVTERNAELAMSEALAAFQAECPPIPRIGTAEVKKNGVKQYEYHFAPFEKIVAVIGPILTRHGLSFTHDGEVNENNVTTICTLRHVAGAKRTATFTAPTDQSGGKNPLQAVGSARSYGRRYTLIDVLGLTTEEDDDGVGAHGRNGGAGNITADQAAELNRIADDAGADKVAFCKVFGVPSIAEIPVALHKQAKRALETKLEQKQGRS